MKIQIPMRVLLFLGVGWLGALAGYGQAAANSRVFVEFRPGQKGPVVAALRAGGGQVHHEFDEVAAVAVTLPQPALEGIRRNPNVVLVEEDPPRYPLGQTTPYGVGMVQAPEAWAAEALGGGGGKVIGVIDSGVYLGHEDLAGASITADDARDGCGHGTHVIGTIRAVDNALGVVGVAPEATVYSVRVFDDNCGWAFASSLMAAVDKAINDAGARIISMSLGGGLKSRTEENFFNQRYSQGILSIAAAGNNGTTQMSYPASYASVISVAAIDSAKLVASFSQRNSQVELAAPGVGVLSTVPFATPTVTVGTETYGAGAIEGAATGSASGVLVDGGRATAGGAWNGKVVLVERGDISFYDKVMNVQASGGVAAVIYNNVEGGFSGTLGTGNSSTIPAISITQEDGLALLAKVGSGATVHSPAPGTPGSGYEYYDGTSMATPHVSAVAALVWNMNPTKSNADIRKALQESALDLGTAGRDNSYGFGLVQAKAALDRLAGGGGGGGSDTTPPVISNVSSQIANSKNGQFKVTWTTDEPATSVVKVVGLGTYSSSTLVTSHSITIKGSKGVTYSYTVESKDAAGNTASSGPYTHRN